MKQLIAAALLFATAAFAGETISRGAAIAKDAKAVPLADVLKTPEEYTKTAVVVEGTVTNACERKGCWMQIAGTDGSHPVRITFKDYAFFVPLDAKGMQARVEGVTEVRTLPKEEVAHLESEGAKFEKNADGTAKEVSFIANGVELTKE